VLIAPSHLSQSDSRLAALGARPVFQNVQISKKINSTVTT